MRPKPMLLEDLARLLRELADMVESGDSLEGSVGYVLPGSEDGELEPGMRMVMAQFRVGNLEGQGGMRVWGDDD